MWRFGYVLLSCLLEALADCDRSGPSIATLRASAASLDGQYFRSHLAAVSQSKNFSADAGRRCTQNTQITVTHIKALDDAYRMHCINDQTATGLQLCMLLKFAKPRLEIKRMAMAYEPHRDICVFCVHRLSVSALKFLLGLQRHIAGNVVLDCT
jgi:hypothetical protein